MRFKRLAYYLLLNVLVSACTVLVILYAWETYRPLDTGPGPGPIVLATATAAALPQSEVPGASPAAGEAGDGNADAAPPDFISYTVQPGDTLSGIAFEFDVTVEAILEANNLDNPDALGVNDVILIPVGGGGDAPVGEATAAPTNSPPPPTLPPATPTAAQEVADLKIVTVIGAGDLVAERVIVRQDGDGQVSLQGWQILAPDGQVYTFPQLVLFTGGAVTVYTRAGGNTVAELYWGLDAAVWESGDVVTLLDPAGEIAAAFQVP